MMRRGGVLTMIALLLIAVACDEPTKPMPPTSTASPAPTKTGPIVIGTVTLPDATGDLDAELERSDSTQFVVTYDASTDIGVAEKWVRRVTFWQDGVSRRRYEIQGEGVVEPPAETSGLSVFIESERTLECAAELPIDPEGEFGLGHTGAWQEGSEWSGNTLYSLGLPATYETRSSRPNPSPEEVDVSVSKVTHELIAGFVARCYYVEVTEAFAELRTGHLCFSDGIMLRYDGPSPLFGGGRLRLVATEARVGVQDTDFRTPYPIVVRPDD